MIFFLLVLVNKAPSSSYVKDRVKMHVQNKKRAEKKIKKWLKNGIKHI